MAMIVGVKFRTSGKTYYFSPGEENFSENDGVICETARGTEYGTVSISNREVPQSKIVSPLKPILRRATEEDVKQHRENLEKREYLMNVTAEKVRKHNLHMKIVDAEYTFDRQKIIIYFTAESRVDFRELVKELAGVFHIRIELRQIYERDDIKMRGALAMCGRPCCCTTHLNDFEKVSVKMAKMQGLSLNPQKISGCCGKLMCCLKYENAYYQEVFHKMPKLNSRVTTPDGSGDVVAQDLLRQEVKVKFESSDGTTEIRTYPVDHINARFKQTAEDLPDDDEGEGEE